MAFSAIRNNDKVGLILFTDEVELYLPPASGRGHILRLIREILFFEPEGSGTDIAAALDFANRVQPRKVVMFLLSDFCLRGAFDSQLEQLQPKLRSTCRRHDLVAVSVNDRREESLPDIGILHIEDAETGEIVSIDTSKKAIRDSFARESARQRTLLRGTFRSSGIDFLELRTGESYLPALKRFFQTRERRLAS